MKSLFVSKTGKKIRQRHSYVALVDLPAGGIATVLGDRVWRNVQWVFDVSCPRKPSEEEMRFVEHEVVEHIESFYTGGRFDFRFHFRPASK